jgi:hypothetical protein
MSAAALWNIAYKNTEIQDRISEAGGLEVLLGACQTVKSPSAVAR